jgi:hypothetical protein
LPSLSPASLVAVAIARVVDVTVAINLVAAACPPPLSPLLLPLKPSLSLSHSTLVTNTIALTLFIAHHPYCHCHCLPTLALFVTCSHCKLIVVFISSADRGGLGHPFAPPIQQAADSSNVARVLSFDAFAFFASNAGAPTTAPGIGADGFTHLYCQLGGAFMVSQHVTI